VLDYHLHLWPHRDRDVTLSLDQIAAYCERARGAGVVEVALTEHLHRFTQATDVVGHFYEAGPGADPSPERRRTMAEYWAWHARNDLEAYVEAALEAKAAGLPVVLGLEVDYFRGQMGAVADLLAQYPFDVLLGSVHWLGAWRFDAVNEAGVMAEWDTRELDRSWEQYTVAMEELSATGACDVLAHPDLIKVAGRVPDAPGEWWDRIAEAAAAGGLAAEISSAGWRKPVAEAYPAPGLLERFCARGVPFTTASDAHELSQVADRADDLRAILSGAGIGHLWAYSARRPRPLPVAPSRPPAAVPPVGH
jgi:histidinol-phosphatase (PHP family)